ncbi:protein C [Tupaia virus]|uniref:Protein C n=1 Tax=Tupaia virus (isolate Tupaia/Thailand/-/1986) TaxID=1560034 RepID=C_TUPVT|nr:protein C [Tupaia virus]Q4VKV6.1 RecName: Full=Protein C [Tupaia virus isolate Tupaia/Thailand/-/1986]AAX47598.1 protein C [Tupaia virus]
MTSQRFQELLKNVKTNLGSVWVEFRSSVEERLKHPHIWKIIDREQLATILMFFLGIPKMFRLSQNMKIRQMRNMRKPGVMEMTPDTNQTEQPCPSQMTNTETSKEPESVSLNSSTKDGDLDPNKQMKNLRRDSSSSQESADLEEDHRMLGGRMRMIFKRRQGMRKKSQSLSHLRSQAVYQDTTEAAISPSTWKSFWPPQLRLRDDNSWSSVNLSQTDPTKN